MDCWASLVAQTVKNPPAVQKTQVPSLGQEDPLEKGMTTHSSDLVNTKTSDHIECWQGCERTGTTLLVGI